MRTKLFAAAAFLVLCISAHADSFVFFNFSTSGYISIPTSLSTRQSYSDPSTGTAILDTTTGIFTELTFATYLGRVNLAGTPLDHDGYFCQSPVTSLCYDVFYNLDYQPNIFLTYSNDEVLVQFDDGFSPIYEDYAAGLIPDATAVTPEPSSFLFLSTGLFGVAGVMRKRFA